MSLALVAAAVANDKPAGVPENVVYATPVDRSLAARTLIDQTDVGNLGKSDLADVVDFAPGMNVRYGGRGQPRIDMRGFDQRATLFTLDGVPIYEPYNGIINFNLFPAELLDSIEIVRGSTSSLYGPNGMAGAIRLRSAQPRGGISGDVSTTWRDSNTWDARASAAAGNPLGRLLIGGRYLDSGGFPLSEDFDDRPPPQRRLEGGGQRNHSDRREWSVFANGSYAISDALQVRATVLESKAEAAIPSRTTSFNPRIRRYEPQELTHAHLALEVAEWLGNELAAAFFYSRYREEERELDPDDLETVLATIEAESDEVGGLLRGERRITDSITLALATQLRYSRADVRDSLSRSQVEPYFTTFSAAIEGKWEATEHLALVGGISADLQAGGDRSDEWQPNPQLGATYDFERWGVTRVSVSRKTRFPTLRELYDPLQGNPDLDAESSWSYEIGHAARFADVGVNLALFRSDVDDLIESSGGRNGDPQPARNLSDAVLQGAEVALDWTPLDALALRANYTYLDAKADNRLTETAGDRAEIQHRPRHRANAIAQASLPLGFTARFETQYISGQVDRFGTAVDLDDAFLINAQAGFDLDRWLSIVVGADNLLDEDYEEAIGMPRPGRWFYTGIRARLPSSFE